MGRSAADAIELVGDAPLVPGPVRDGLPLITERTDGGWMS